MHLLGLVKKFQYKLGVSKANAIWRVVGFFSFLACFLIAAGYFIIVVHETYFGASSIAYKIPLLSGTYTQTYEKPKRIAPLNVEQFVQQIARNDGRYTISLEERNIVYKTTVDEIPYYYRHIVFIDSKYKFVNQRIEDRLIRIEAKKDIELAIGKLLFIFICMGISFLILLVIQVKVEDKADRSRNKKVWVSWVS